MNIFLLLCAVIVAFVAGFFVGIWFCDNVKDVDVG